MLFKILSCYWIIMLVFPIYATQHISYTTVSPSVSNSWSLFFVVIYSVIVLQCHLYTTTEMHEKCGVYAYLRIKPLLIDIHTQLNQIKLLESVIESKNNSIYSTADDCKKAILVAYNTISSKDDEISNLTAENQIIETQLKSKNDIIRDKDKQIDTLNLEVLYAKNNYDAQIFLLNSQLLDLNKAIEGKDKQISVLGNTIQDLQNTISTKDKGFTDLQGELGKLNSKIFTLGQTNEEKDKQLIENGKTIEILQADVLKKDNLLALQNQQSGKLVEKEKTIEEYKQKINNLQVDVNNKDNRISALQTTVNSYSSTLQSKDSQLSQAQSKVYTLQAELDELKRRPCHSPGSHPYHHYPHHGPPHIHHGPPFPHHHYHHHN